MIDKELLAKRRTISNKKFRSKYVGYYTHFYIPHAFSAHKIEIPINPKNPKARVKLSVYEELFRERTGKSLAAEFRKLVRDALDAYNKRMRDLNRPEINGYKEFLKMSNKASVKKTQ